ncbi:MAG TPA: AraC family transcriptional regulator [Terriglobales bacterium]
MLIRPTPGAVVWPAAMIVWGPAFASARHSHHCVQLLMAMDGTLEVRSGPRHKWKKCGAALVRPDASHEVDAHGTNVLLIAFVDAESELGAALSERIIALSGAQSRQDGISCVPESQVARWRAMLGPRMSESRVERWVRKELLNGERPVSIHPRVRRALKYLREHLSAADDLSLKALAQLSGLSSSRFMHVFTESVGVPLRPYILWLRLQRASCELMAGVSITDAAHNAGFSDAAHLTRTFRRMLGTTPTDLALRKRMSRGVSVE